MDACAAVCIWSEWHVLQLSRLALKEWSGTECASAGVFTEWMTWQLMQVTPCFWCTEYGKFMLTSLWQLTHSCEASLYATPPLIARVIFSEALCGSWQVVQF